jgi:hypothetical protein
MELEKYVDNCEEKCVKSLLKNDVKECSEEWRKISGWDNYEASNLGNVRNSKTGRILKPSSKGGYLYIGLSSTTLIKHCSIHRLIAKTFIDNPENKPQVNHKDKNRGNNNVSNLEWSTASENNIHRSTNVSQKTNQNIIRRSTNANCI